MTSSGPLRVSSADALSDCDLGLFCAAIQNDAGPIDADLIRSRLQEIHTTDETVLAPQGMYVVLDGSVDLRQGGSTLATADQGDYFYEEHLEIFNIPVTMEARAQPGTRLAYLPSAEWFKLPEDARAEVFSTLFGDLVAVHMQNFQQPINCCSVTAAALSMSALGFTCEVNDIFRECQLPANFVVNDGISLAELFDVACTFIHRQGLRETVQVQAYFMDAATTSPQKLLEAIDESNRLGGDNDILVANFQVGMAHAKAMTPGGHFAIIAKCNPSTGLIHMIDVHPEKYGKLWVTTIDRLYAAMSDRDGTSMRSRGLLRFSARNAVTTRLQCLDLPCRYVDTTRYLAAGRRNKRNLFRRASPNLNSLGVLSESLAILGDTDVDEDKLLLYSEAGYSEALSRVADAREMDTIAKMYLAQATHTHLSSEFRSYAERPDDSQDLSPDAWFTAQLRDVAGQDGRHLMINIDLNRVLGFDAIKAPDTAYRETALLEEFWCLCIDYDEASDEVTLVDMSPATSQVWQAPRPQIFRGLRDPRNPRMVAIEERAPVCAPDDAPGIIEHNPIVLFYDDEDPWSNMLRNILGNIGVTQIAAIDVSGREARAVKMRRQLVAMTGQDSVPYLFFKGECLGEREDIVGMIMEGSLQKRIDEAGLPVLLRHESPSLDRNIFGYPKGGLTERPDGKRNVLLAACGSSAADKIPELIERITDAGHNVKLIPSVAAEKFFKDHGAERILSRISPNDIYRDDDEWNFHYIEHGMPLRASHLALCDWADCVVVAPVTCNTMGKIANGIADNLISSIFVAWQYQRKPSILCPACNTHMWNNITTQNNVAALRTLGVDFVGPRSGTLSNGRQGIGMMALPDQIMMALDQAFEQLDDQDSRVIAWARDAAASDEYAQWRRIFRSIDEGVVGINVIDELTGDTMLHFAAGGEGEMTESGITRGVPDLEVARDLIARGINVNTRNDMGFTALHVAIANESSEMVDILLGAEGIDARPCLHFIRDETVPEPIRARLKAWAESTGAAPEPTAPDAADDPPTSDDEPSYLYFTYGSLKRGFPNHEAYAEALGQYVGQATTRQPMPLVVQKEAACSNENCRYLHRMATLVDLKGRGVPVEGEVYRVTASALRTLDALEGYVGQGAPDNVYLRKKIAVVIGGAVQHAYAYVIADPAPHLAALEDGSAETVPVYTFDMAQGDLKPGHTPAQQGAVTS